VGVREHFNSRFCQEFVSHPQGGVTRQEYRSGSFHCLLVDLSDSNHVELKLTEEAANKLTESISPDKRLHGESEDHTVGRLIKVVSGKHYHHNDSGTVGPEVDYNLIKATVLPVSDATSLEDKVPDSCEFSALLDAEDNRRLEDSDLQALCIVN